MIKVSSSIIIERPVEAVWAYVSNFENDPQWWTGILKSEIISDIKEGIGTVYRQDAVFMGTRFESIFEVTEYDPPHHLTLTTTKSLIPFVAKFWFEPADGGKTRLTMDSIVEAGGIFRVIKPLFTVILRRQSQGFFNMLKKVAESPEFDQRAARV